MRASFRIIAAFVAATLAVMSSAREVPIDGGGQVLPIEEEGPRAPDIPVASEHPVTKDYILVGADSVSNPYNGDTSTANANSLLCIYALGLPKPAGLPAPIKTPGGALKNSWSGGKLFLVPHVTGTSITSPAVGDNLCATWGEQTFGTHGARMAEHHDGANSEGWAGWGFWAEKLSPAQGQQNYDGRLWVKINGQRSNPWDNGGGVRLALTWVKKSEIKL